MGCIKQQREDMMADNLSNETEEFIIHAYPMVKCDNPECKKGEFCRPTKSWGYKLYYKGKLLFFCSYSCMRKIEKLKEAEEENKKRKQPPKVDLRRRKRNAR
jgi:YHS domain-containing protein